MFRLRPILIGILVFAVSTVWVKERWATAMLETAVFLAAAWLSLRTALAGERACAPGPAILLGGMYLWALLQMAASWTMVRAETAQAVLYWLSAACLVCLAQQVCSGREERRLFLQAALAAGSAICLLGIVQLFTSEGRIFWLFASGYDSSVIGPFVSPNNYAAFVELLLPIALYLSFQDSRHSKAYLVVAAALVASVIAGGSRAGSAIVIAEAAVAVLALRRHRAIRRHSVTFAILAAAFTLILGYQYLWTRAAGFTDPYLVRREFVQSSLAMIRTQPLHGFGFGVWPWAYREFAILDTGLRANHAHNEWIQWAAEGGLPAFALMLLLCLSCLRPAFRSVWGLGVIAVFLHSLVDYPFLHLGLAAWIFAMIGALAAYSRETSTRRGTGRRLVAPLPRVLALAAVPALAFGIFQTLELAWADVLYRRATPGSLAAAERLCPEIAEYHLALAEVDRELSVPRLERAIALNPYLTQARISLAAEWEERNDLAAAERMLLAAARHDRQYAPAWALANFYFRRNQPQRFWPWARKAAEMAYDDLAPLFDLCFRLPADAPTVAERVVVPRRFVERQYLAYLADTGRLPEAQAAALRVVSHAQAADRECLLGYIDRAIASARYADALAVWNALCRQRLLPYAPAGAGTLVNGDFAQPVFNRAFDWKLPSIPGVTSVRLKDSGVQIGFSGRQPEEAEILSQFLPLRRGPVYVLRFQYRTTGLPRETGLFWSWAGEQRPVLEAVDNWSIAEWRIRAPVEAAPLVLVYRRCPGTTRSEGTLLLRRIELKQESL